MIACVLTEVIVGEALVGQGDVVTVAVQDSAERAVEVGVAVQGNGIVRVLSLDVGGQRRGGLARAAEQGRLEANTGCVGTLAD